jgi:hypothetical protein
LPLSPLPFTACRFAIGTDETFAWRVRLGIERCLRNLTDGHVAIIQYVADMAEAGHGQLAHALIAATLSRGVRTVRDALQRGRALGLLDWQAHYEPRPGSVLRWRTANSYRRTMPGSPAVPRPDVRRHDGGTLRRARQEASNQAAFEQGSRPQRPAWAMPDLLAARRRAVEAELLTKRGYGALPAT